MPDFMIGLFTQSGWLAWLVFALAVSGGLFWAIQGGLAARWLYWKARPCHCETCDPPEYQPDEEPGEDWAGWDEPGEDWSPGLAWGPSPFARPSAMASLAEVLARAAAMGLLDPAEIDEHVSGPPCTDRDCELYGEPHPPPCALAPTMPAACYTDPAGPAGPPVPWSGLHASLETLARSEDVPPALHPVVAAELGHDTTEGAVDSMFTRAMAKEVKGMETGNG